MADPSPFIQGQWMHGLAPIVFAVLCAFSAGYCLGALMARHACETERATHTHPPRLTLEEAKAYYDAQWQETLRTYRSDRDA